MMITRLEENLPESRGTLVPVVVAGSEDASTVLLRVLLSAIAKTDDRSRAERRTTAPLVVLLQSNYPHRQRDIEGLINSLAIQSEILNRKSNFSTSRASKLRGVKDSWPEVVSLAISSSTNHRSFESLASAFIQKNLLDTQGLQLVLTKIEENQRSVNRQSVASTSIPKVRLDANGFNIPTIDDSDTAYEDDQRLLLNSGFEENELCKILHTTCWSNGDFFSTLPMRENYIRDVLVGYALEGATNLELVSTQLSLGRVTDALSSAMVNYGPLGFTESANFERECSLDSDIADKLRQIGGITTTRKLAEVLDSAMGRKFQEWLAGEEKIQTTLCAEFEAKMTPRDSAILDFVRAVLSVCEVSVDGGDA
jgi:hypothetical protein